MKCKLNFEFVNFTTAIDPQRQTHILHMARHLVAKTKSDLAGTNGIIPLASFKIGHFSLDDNHSFQQAGVQLGLVTKDPLTI